jgi:hypothetical protein
VISEEAGARLQRKIEGAKRGIGETEKGRIGETEQRINGVRLRHLQYSSTPILQNS